MALSRGTDIDLQARSTNNMQLLPDAHCAFRATFPLAIAPIFGPSASPRQLARSACGSVRRGWVLHSIASPERGVHRLFELRQPQRTDSWLWRTSEAATLRHGTEDRSSIERLPSRICAQHCLKHPHHHRETATRLRDGPRRPTLHRVPSRFNDVVLDSRAPQRSSAVAQLDHTHLKSGSTTLWSPNPGSRVLCCSL